ncbi:hypothetical protein [Bacillus wiedmannii]|uniref:hypothetical protein n=2 Tax=Bacillus wiedmannii TaxID=1890302 RepID=UPI001F603410|nr:hypothetical protein [Bacillus wiedmannii]MED3124430.1 hypothetical protein [Bacillus wiedmannii]
MKCIYIYYFLYIIFMKYKAIAAGMLAASLLAYPVSSLAETKKFSDVRDDSFAKRRNLLFSRSRWMD